MTKNNNNKTKVNKELEGFDIKVNELGEIIYTHSVDELNTFLDKHVDDKKLRSPIEGKEKEDSLES